MCGNARVACRVSVIQDGFKGACLAVTAAAGLERRRVYGNARDALRVTPGAFLTVRGWRSGGRCGRGNPVFKGVCLASGRYERGNPAACVR